MPNDTMIDLQLEQMSVAELRRLAERQQSELEAQQAVLRGKEEHVKGLYKQYEAHLETESQLRKAKATLKAQEDRLRHLRRVRGEASADSVKADEMSVELSKAQTLFRQKQEELKGAASRVDALAAQLQSLRHNGRSVVKNVFDALTENATAAVRSSSDSDTRFSTAIAQKQSEVHNIDGKINRVKDRLRKRQRPRIDAPSFGPGTTNGHHAMPNGEASAEFDASNGSQVDDEVSDENFPVKNVAAIDGPGPRMRRNGHGPPRGIADSDTTAHDTIATATPAVEPSADGCGVVGNAESSRASVDDDGSDNDDASPSKLVRRVSFDPLALLLDASLEGELELVRKTVKEVTNPSAANNEGITALHNAICAGHLEVVRFLVQYGCDVNAQDSDGWSPLHCAASCNNLEMLRLLIENGACVLATTFSDNERASEKCEEEEEGYASCFQFLRDVEEGMGRRNGGVVCAAYDFDAQNNDELSFRRGDALTIVNREDNKAEKEWWWAEKDGREGFVPRNMFCTVPVK